MPKPSFTELSLDDSLEGCDDVSPILQPSTSNRSFAPMNEAATVGKENFKANFTAWNGAKNRGIGKKRNRKVIKRSLSQRKSQSHAAGSNSSRGNLPPRRPRSESIHKRSQAKENAPNVPRHQQKPSTASGTTETGKKRGQNLRVVRNVNEARRMDWDHAARPVIVSSRGAGTGLFAQPSRRSLSESGIKQRPLSRAEANADAAAAREEVISMRIEHNAQNSLVEMLTQRCARLGSQLERQQLETRAVESRLRQTQDELDKMRQSTQSRDIRGTQLEEQVEMLRDELHTVRRSDKEKDQSLLQLSKALREAQAQSREQSAQSSQETSMADRLIMEERHRNAGLMQQLQMEQKRVVELAAKIRELENLVTDGKAELGRAISDVDMEREWRERAQGDLQKSNEQRVKLQERVAALLGQLDNERAQAYTARERADNMAADARRSKLRVQEEAAQLGDVELKLKQAQGHVAMRDRRIQLLKKQLQQEKSLHEEARKECQDLKRQGEKMSKKLASLARKDVSDSLEIDDGGGFMPPMTKEEIKKLGPMASNEPVQPPKPPTAAGAGESVVSTGPEPPSSRQRNIVLRKPVQKVIRKPSRRDNLGAIRKMMDALPDPSKMPGSDAPDWVRDDGL